MQKISTAQFYNAWMDAYENNESWMGVDTIIENVAVELQVTEEFVKTLITKWKNSGRELPGCIN